LGSPICCTKDSTVEDGLQAVNRFVWNKQELDRMLRLSYIQIYVRLKPSTKYNDNKADQKLDISSFIL
jgi:hypothetical protein